MLVYRWNNKWSRKVCFLSIVSDERRMKQCVKWDSISLSSKIISPATASDTELKFPHWYFVNTCYSTYVYLDHRFYFKIFWMESWCSQLLHIYFNKLQFQWHFLNIFFIFFFKFSPPPSYKKKKKRFVYCLIWKNSSTLFISLFFEMRRLFFH